MSILKQIEDLAQKGIKVEYNIVDQFINGNKKDVGKGYVPRITYTVYVTIIEDEQEIYSESCDELEIALKQGVNASNEYLSSRQ